MPRSKRTILSNHSYHITHRCYNREFRLKFAIDRDNYRMRLFETAQRYEVNVLDYMITSNHVHLLLWSEKPKQVSEAMRFLQGSSAQDYNRRKKRSGAFWSGRYNTTLIEDGSHLSRCFFYVGLNMVRTGAVKHPSEWKWCGFHEHMGLKTRYKIINKEALFKSLAYSIDTTSFQNWYINTINKDIGGKVLFREPFWTEAIAVGGCDWIKKISGVLSIRKRDIEKIHSSYTQEKTPSLRVCEERESYVLRGSKRDQSCITRV